MTYNEADNPYRKAHAAVLADLPAWKRNAYLEDIADKRDSRIVDEVAKLVVEKAESVAVAAV